MMEHEIRQIFLKQFKTFGDLYYYYFLFLIGIRITRVSLIFFYYI